VVKRQTVWLSTMMVLSLMLIGYYTMNNGSDVTAGKSQGPSVSTSTSAPSGSTNSSSSGSVTTGAPDSGSQASTGSSSDFFIQMQTQVEQQISQQEDQLMQVISNNNASSSDISKAETQLKQLTALDGGIKNATDMILGQGYTACAIVPTPGQLDHATVYVKSNKLTASDAVKIMNIVSQQLNIPISNVVVKMHA
jgi:stage III sporulation protein AH